MTVLTTAQLVTQLGGRRALEIALGCAQWQRVLRGVFTDGELDLGARIEASRLVLPPDAVVAGRSALWLCGATYVQDDDGPLEVLVPRRAVVAERPGLLVREGLIPADDRGTVRGIPTLRPARAAVDVARRGTLTDAVGVLDVSLRLQNVDRDGLAEQVSRAARRRGVAVARRALPLADARAESPPESWLRVVLFLAGYAPEPQHVVLDAGGEFVARVDLALVRERVVLEYDGRAAHGADQFAGDRSRQNALVAAGWTVLRFTSEDLTHPERVLQRVAAVLAVRAAA